MVNSPLNIIQRLGNLHVFVVLHIIVLTAACAPLAGLQVCHAAAPAEELISPLPYKRTIQLSGFTRPIQKMSVSSEVSGTCLQVFADVGEAVPDSGIFAVLDDTFIRLDLTANDLAQQKIRRQLAEEEKTLERYTTLWEKNTTTLAKLDEVKLQASLHEITLQDLANTRRRLEETQSRYIITAPKGWEVMERMIEPGEYAQPGQSLAVLGNFRQLLVSMALSFNELQALQQTGEILLQLPDLQTAVTARIHRISPDFDALTRKIPVDLIIAGEHPRVPHTLRSGVRTEMSLSVESKAHTFLVPNSALINRYESYWVVGEGGRRVKVIFLGTSPDGVSVIISAPGLQVTDRLLKHAPTDTP